MEATKMDKRELAPNWGLKIGVMTPGTNLTVEEEFWSMRVRGATMATARIVIDQVDWTKHDGLERFVKDVNKRLPETAKRVAQVEPDLLTVGISSSNLWGGLAGNDEIKKKLEKETGIRVVTPVDAVVKIAEIYGVKKIGVITPYPEIADEKIVEFFSEFGVTVVAQKGLRITSPLKIGEVSPEALIDALNEVNVPEAEAVFQLGTDLKFAKVAAESESWLGKPTISINTATWWHTLRVGGNTQQLTGWGNLFAEH
jgi:maleate isomerase